MIFSWTRIITCAHKERIGTRGTSAPAARFSNATSAFYCARLNARIRVRPGEWSAVPCGPTALPTVRAAPLRPPHAPAGGRTAGPHLCHIIQHLVADFQQDAFPRDNWTRKCEEFFLHSGDSSGTQDSSSSYALAQKKSP